MKKYMRKPIIVHAMQWTGDNLEKINSFLKNSIKNYRPCIKGAGIIENGIFFNNLSIPSLLMDEEIGISDYIIIHRENAYGMQRSKFEAQYQLIEEEYK